MKIAYTGHRPDKLGGYNNLDAHNLIKEHMKNSLLGFQRDFGEVTVISGGALGIDQFVMEVAHELKIPVIAAIPFEGFDSKWPIYSRQKFARLLAKCKEVNYIENEFSKRSYQARNEWMVDQCDLLVAYWDGTNGGTANCMAYALEKKRDTLRFDPKDIIGKLV